MISTIFAAWSKCTQLAFLPIRCIYSTWVFPIRVMYGLFTSLFSPAPKQLPPSPEATIRARNVRPKECTAPCAIPFVRPTRREALRRDISAKAKLERALAQEDSPIFVSLLNLTLRRYIKELSRLPLKELHEEFQICFYLNPPLTIQYSPRPYFDAMGQSKSTLLAYRTIMLTQMTSHALGLCSISPRDAYEFRQPDLSEGFSAKLTLRLVMDKYEFLKKRSRPDATRPVAQPLNA